MRSIDIATLIVSRRSKKRAITNLSLNKLVYFAQVESLKTRNGVPLFNDRIEAWEYGPVEPAVYYAFKQSGHAPVSISPGQNEAANALPSYARTIVDSVIDKYGDSPAFDLVSITHRESSAWRNTYVEGQNVEITLDDIISSKDFTSDVDLSDTLSAGIRSVENKWPNALRMLQDA